MDNQEFHQVDGRKEGTWSPDPGQGLAILRTSHMVERQQAPQGCSVDLPGSSRAALDEDAKSPSACIL